MTIAVAISGGMDSLFALANLKALAEAQGHSVFALHGLFLEPELRPQGYGTMLERMRRSCAALAVPLHLVDCAQVFRQKVIDPFVRAYADGLTPNPCALCNKFIKFGFLLEQAEALGATRLATGHYARLERRADGSCALYSAADGKKDQSYFLALVPLKLLEKALFPLARTEKSTLPEWLGKRGLLVPETRESQEICFVPRDAYRSFIPVRAEAMGITLPGPGPVALPDGRIIGRHNGLWQYTEGQRKGLGIAWEEPLYVRNKDLSANTLVVSPKSREQEKDAHFSCGSLNYLVQPREWPEMVLLKTRYRQNAVPAKWMILGDMITFTPQRSEYSCVPDAAPCYASGQVAAVYAPEPEEHGHMGKNPALRLLGGGIIIR